MGGDPDHRKARTRIAQPLPPTLPFFTIGHSTRPIDEFAALLRESAIARVIDVRTVPRSRTNPQYNRDTLPAALDGVGIAYAHMAELGGLRPRSHDVAADVNGFWENASFHNYADYALGSSFAAGLQSLRDTGHGERCVVMCSEAVWWRCHRRIISDYLIARGEEVFHIMGHDKVDAATLTPAARPQGDVVVYPAA